eukprot:TRINITY_DN1157_c1_g1_i2.p1 TRINITY_DN1157_c1_g1~~TRINITY_DN1157_c1_g1_i2.p1  ORF type:complete len:524 (-),score=175.61 TRINITY_DN1157_c1_g1_i2:100-1671(-)
MRFENRANGSSKTVSIILVVFLLASLAGHFWVRQNHNTEIETLQETLEHRAKLIVDLEEGLSSSKLALQNTQNKLEESQDRISDLTRSVSEANTNIARLQKEAKSVASELSTTSSYVTELHDQISSLKKELAESQNKYNKQTKDTADLLAQLEEAQKDLDKTHKDNIKAHEDISSLKKEIERHTHDSAAMSRERDVLKTEKNSLQEKLLKAESESSKHESSLRVVSTQLKSTQERLQEIESENAELPQLRTEIAALKLKCQEVESPKEESAKQHQIAPSPLSKEEQISQARDIAIQQQPGKASDNEVDPDEEDVEAEEPETEKHQTEKEDNRKIGKEKYQEDNTVNNKVRYLGASEIYSLHICFLKFVEDLKEIDKANPGKQTVLTKHTDTKKPREVNADYPEEEEAQYATKMDSLVKQKNDIERQKWLEQEDYDESEHDDREQLNTKAGEREEEEEEEEAAAGEDADYFDRVDHHLRGKENKKEGKFMEGDEDIDDLNEDEDEDEEDEFDEFDLPKTKPKRN